MGVEKDGQLEKIVAESGLESTKAAVMLKQFQDYFELAAEWEVKAKTIVVTDDSQTDDMKVAREGRLFLRQKRIAIEKTRKELKEQALREGKAIDGIANVLKALIVPIEEHLDKQERYVEIKAAEQAEMDRIAGEKLRAENERLEKQKAIEEQKRVEEENARLRREAVEREKVAAAEREKVEREKREAEEKARKEREEVERKARLEREEIEEKARAERKKIESEARKKREEAARIANERTRKAEAEKARAEREKRELEAQLARMVECPECGAKFDPNGPAT